MSFSHAEFLEMQARCDRANGLRQPALAIANSKQLEVGAGGIQEEIEDWLKTQSRWAWWTRSRTDKATTNRVGTPDFVGVFGGVAFGMEVKRPGQKTTPEQDGELLWMKMAGAQTAVVYSKDGAVDFLLGLLNKTPAGEPLSAGATTSHPAVDSESH